MNTHLFFEAQGNGRDVPKHRRAAAPLRDEPVVKGVAGEEPLVLAEHVAYSILAAAPRDIEAVS